MQAMDMDTDNVYTEEHIEGVKARDAQLASDEADSITELFKQYLRFNLPLAHEAAGKLFDCAPDIFSEIYNKRNGVNSDSSESTEDERSILFDRISELERAVENTASLAECRRNHVEDLSSMPVKSLASELKPLYRAKPSAFKWITHSGGLIKNGSWKDLFYDMAEKNKELSKEIKKMKKRHQELIGFTAETFTHSSEYLQSRINEVHMKAAN